MPPSQDSGSPSFNRARHVKYWLRCFKTFLPTGYTSNDSNRMTLAFFIVSALDLLGLFEGTAVTAEEKKGCVDWVYHCQRPDGGFRGFPATDLGPQRTVENGHWDPINLPATFFALATLMVLGDDMSRVKRRACLALLARLQRRDGSFGEVLGEHEQIEGASDIRFCYFAAAVRWILRGRVAGDLDEVPDLDVDALVRYINRSETYDHGYAEAPQREAHAGLTYCAIGALSFLDRMCPCDGKMRDENTVVGSLNREQTLRWLVSRQINYVESEDDEDEERPDGEATAHNLSNPAPNLASQEEPMQLSSDSDFVVGFNGRCNKVADTCYSFWVAGSVASALGFHPNTVPFMSASSCATAQYILSEYATDHGKSSPRLH